MTEVLLYAPRWDQHRFEYEPFEAYSKRISPELPNFPPEVLKQWFYDHAQQTNEHSWLGYKNLKFSREIWSTEMVPVNKFGKDACVETYKRNFFSGRVKIPKTDRIADYFRRCGTWPVPPIFLENFEEGLKYPNGFPCGSPYHLIEGHNRMAQFLGFKEQGILKDQHSVWLVKKTK